LQIVIITKFSQDTPCGFMSTSLNKQRVKEQKSYMQTNHNTTGDRSPGILCVIYSILQTLLPHINRVQWCNGIRQRHQSKNLK